MLRLYVMHETYDVVPAYDSTGPFRSMSAGHKGQTCPSGFPAKERNEQAVIRGLSKVGCDMETTEQVIELAIVTWSGLYRRLGAFTHPRSLSWFVQEQPADRDAFSPRTTTWHQKQRFADFTTPLLAGLACDASNDTFKLSYDNTWRDCEMERSKIGLSIMNLSLKETVALKSKQQQSVQMS